jgi:hypothetical protein
MSVHRTARGAQEAPADPGLYTFALCTEGQA